MHLPDISDNPRVRNDNPVHPRRIDPVNVFPEVHKVTVAGKNIYCYIDPGALLMSKPDPFGHFFFVKVSGPGPQAEMPSTEVDGIGAVGYGNLQFFQTSRWRQ